MGIGSAQQKHGQALTLGAEDKKLLRKLMVLHEGERAHWYPDSKGYATIGIGRCIEHGVGPGLRLEEMHEMARNNFLNNIDYAGPLYSHLQRQDDGVALLGPGRDVGLKGLGLLPSEIDRMFWNDMKHAEEALTVHLPWFSKLSAVRRVVVMDMFHQLGISKLTQKFPKFLVNMKRGYWQAAGWEIVLSRLAPNRAKRLKMMMITDEWPGEVL